MYLVLCEFHTNQPNIVNSLKAEVNGIEKSTIPINSLPLSKKKEKKIQFEYCVDVRMRIWRIVWLNFAVNVSPDVCGYGEWLCWWCVQFDNICLSNVLEEWETKSNVKNSKYARLWRENNTRGYTINFSINIYPIIAAEFNFSTVFSSSFAHACWRLIHLRT